MAHIQRPFEFESGVKVPEREAEHITILPNEISGSHGGEYADVCLLLRYAERSLPAFQMCSDDMQ
jgi:hypothetical protein